MKKFGILIFAAAVIIGVCIASSFSFGRINNRFFKFSFNEKTKGSGTIATESHKLRDFKGIDVSGVFQVEVTAQKDFAVEVEADDNLLPLIQTEVRDGVLHIESEGRISTDNGLKVRIFAPDITSIDASGVSKVTVADINNDYLRVCASGATKAVVTGSTARLSVEVSGASAVDAENLRAQNAEVEASGASSVSVFATGELRTDASGASKIVYGGTPTNVEKSSSGASTIREK